jgi:hypothetical protein
MTITYLPNASKKFNLEKTSYKKKRVKWNLFHRANRTLFYKIKLFTEKNKNILHSYFIPNIFIKFYNNSCVKYSNSLCEITTFARSQSPRA